MSELLTVAQAAGRLAVSKKTVQRILAEGNSLTATRKGNKLFIDSGALENYIKLCTFRALPKQEQNRRIWYANIGPNAAQEVLLIEENVRANKTLFPYSGPAIYFLYQGDKIVYVGQAKNLLRRVAEHFGDKPFDHFSWVPCELKDLNELERRAILKYQPELNKI